MDPGIAGKNALVTASSAGMGRNIAHALAAEGVNVALFARSADKLDMLAREIEQQHGTFAITFPGDMRAAAGVDQLAKMLKREFGGPDILVLNTGRAPNPIRAVLKENEEARWHESYQIQL